MDQRKRSDKRDNRSGGEFRGGRNSQESRGGRGARAGKGDAGGRDFRGGRPSAGAARGDSQGRSKAPSGYDRKGASERSFSSEEKGAPLKRYAAEKRRPLSQPASDDLCWGRNPVLTLLENKPSLCRKVTLLTGAQDDFREKIARLCADNGVPLDVAEREDLDLMTGGAVHQGVAARMSPLPPADLDDVVDGLDPQAPALVVLMDHCQDPHNLGAVIRTAEVAGAACVICQNDRSATVNGTVVKTSAGAAFRLPVVQVVNVNRALERLKAKNFWVVGLDHHTEETIWTSPLPERMVLVVGSEGEGISALVSKNCDKLVKFPMAGNTGNLNASVAAALGMFEWVRLHLAK